jgi:hypothetical protein
VLGVFSPGAVIQADVLRAGYLEAERDDSSGDAGAARSSDRLFHIHTFSSEEFAEFCGALHAALFDQFGKGDTGSSGHVAGAYAGPGLRCTAGETTGGPGVQDLRVLGDHLLHPGKASDGIVVEFGAEAYRCALNLSRLHGETGFGPGAEAAVENVNILCSEGAQHPPGSRCREDLFLLVDDDGYVIADAETRNTAREVLGRGQHVGQQGGVIGHLVDIEEDRARDVIRDVPRAGVGWWGDTHWRKRRVKNYGAGIVEATGQPGGCHERIHETSIVRARVSRRETSESPNAVGLKTAERLFYTADETQTYLRSLLNKELKYG